MKILSHHNTIYIFLFSVFLFNTKTFLSLAQPGQWTWIKGSNTGNSPGNFGMQGVPSMTNEPPAVYESCEWTDLNGNFWLYGGVDYLSGYLSNNDLWKYDPLTNEWTWIKGTHTLNDPGNYGARGVPSPTNQPPGLGWGSATWTDTNGDLWLFGGGGIGGLYSDLWKYNILSNQWTWMKGGGQPQSGGPHGTITVPDTANFPDARNEVVTRWVDDQGDLWLFGGYSVSGNYYNDLWRYNIATNTFTWMKGSITTNYVGNWGTKGVENSTNEPSGRVSYSHWKDNSGNLWMMGGWAGDTIPPQNNTMGDMWRYRPSKNNWTWMSGLNYGSWNQYFGHYGTKCVADSLNYPPHRMESRAVWTDSDGNFWLFGGTIGTVFTDSTYNDLWKYCVSTDTWIWVSGESNMNSAGSYGTQGVSSPLNRPPARAGSVSWRDNSNHLYLFGGENNISVMNHLNDLWRFEIDTNCVPCPHIVQLPLPLFTANDSDICEGVCINFNNQSQYATSYLWSFPGGIPSSDTNAIPPQVCYFNSGTYNVTLTAYNSNGSTSTSQSNLITVYPAVQFSPLVQHGDTLFSVPGYSTYNWYLDTTLIPGATNYYYVATQNGNYTVHVLDSNGCSATATLIDVFTGYNELQKKPISFSTHYVSGNLSVVIDQSSSSEITIELYDYIGKRIYSDQVNLQPGKNLFEINGLRLSKGIYIVKVYNEKFSGVKNIFAE